MKEPNASCIRESLGNLAAAAGRHRKLLSLTTIVAAIVFSSCVSVPHAVLVPPTIAGAEFVGTQECAMCHEDLVDGFEWSSHGSLIAHGDESMHLGCEACHGPGSMHVESGGMPNTIVNPVNSAEACFQCHLETRGSFHLPYGHDMHSGNMSCTDCHDPHGDASAGGGMALASASQSCVSCHQAQGNHYVFRHEATQDGCTVCHTPHGSVNDKMLKSANSSLCMQCHFQQQTASGQIMIGGRDHSFFLPRGSCWTAGCHEAVHGSNISSSLRY